MSDFSCPIVSIEAIRRWPEADRLEIARTIGREVIVPKGRYEPGALAVYVPEGAVLPSDLAASLRGTTKLHGKANNRVRPFMLRGQLSDGLLIGPLPAGTVGQDMASMFGITEYAGPLPHQLSGETTDVVGLTVPYDIRDIRKFPDALYPNEQVELTEKVHGSLCIASFVPGLESEDAIDGNLLVYSKGLAQQGRAYRNCATNCRNVYLRAAKRYELRDRIVAMFGVKHRVTLFGEVYGEGIQDLTYGKELGYALFDVFLGTPEHGHFLGRTELDTIGDRLGPRVPVLYRGGFDTVRTADETTGTTVEGRGVHMQEGVVIRPLRERTIPRLGRVILKSVSNQYRTRHGNATEHH